MKKILLLALLATSIITCKKPDPDPPGPNSNALILHEKEAAPYQYISGIMPTGVTPAEIAQNFFVIKIGDSTAYGYRLSTLALDAVHGKDKYYGFQVMVPEMPAGSYACVIAASTGAECKADLSVKVAVPIPDPQAYINDYASGMSGYFAEVSAEYDKSVLNGEITKAKADSLKLEIKAALDLTPTYYADLNPEERRIYAHLLQSNKHLLDDFKKEISQYNLPRGARSGPQDCSPLLQKQKAAEQAGSEHEDEANMYKFQADQCESTNAGYIMVASNDFLGKLQAAHFAAKAQYNSTTGWLGTKAALAYVSTLGSGYKQIATDEIDKVKEYFNSLVNANFIQEIHKKAEERFDEAKEYKMAVGVFSTNMTHSSAASVSQLKSIMDYVKKYNALIGSLSDFIPFLDELELPPARSENINFTEYTINDISDSRIKAESLKVAGGTAVKFTMDNMTSDVSFTFKVKIGTRFNSLEKVIDAVLTPVISIYGKWFSPGGNDYFIFSEDGTTTFYNANGEPQSTAIYNVATKELTFDDETLAHRVYKLTLLTQTSAKFVEVTIGTLAFTLERR